MRISKLIIVFIVLFLTFCYKSKKIEHYDKKIINKKYETCAQICKIISNCYAFGYDPIKKICYPSQSFIEEKPLESFYKDDFSYKNIKCNKIFPITKGLINPSMTERRDNSIYVCWHPNYLYPKYYYNFNDKLINIKKDYNIDKIFKADEYNIINYDWD